MALCGGFICTKNALTALNSVYIIVAIILIVVGALVKGFSIVTSLPAVAGIIAAGVFLLLVAILGLYGAYKHHQVILFFYMIILFLIFLIQFFVAVACLAVNQSQVKSLIERRWNQTSEPVQRTAMEQFHCCVTVKGDTCDSEKFPFCQTARPCTDCFSEIPPRAVEALHVAGGIGLFFSFTEILGIWLAMRFRNQKNPRADPNMFL